jgi:hypothetical protein
LPSFLSDPRRGFPSNESIHPAHTFLAGKEALSENS